MQHMFMDVVIGKVLVTLARTDQKKINIDELENKVALISHIFRNEYIDRVNLPLSFMLRTRI